MPIEVFPYVYGDSGDPLGDHSTAIGQVITFDEESLGNILVGDAPALTAHASGGADTLSGLGGLKVGTAIGDALTISGHARGGDDNVFAGGRSNAFAYGDAYAISDHGIGGDDIVVAGSRFGSFAYGDAQLLTDFARGGNDTLTGSTDGLGTIHTTLFGDADTMQGKARGGDDVLTASNSAVMYGDARVMSDKAAGGNDTLVSGSGADTMWGDGAVVDRGVRTGDDLFVFAPQNGHDQIMDYEDGKDHIALDGFGFANFAALAQHFQPVTDGVLISFNAANDIFVLGITVGQLSASDFVLT